MDIKLLVFSETVPIPKLGFKLGVGLLSVWIDGKGFECASNTPGGIGYLLLETPFVPVPLEDPEKLEAFRDLHGKVVTFDLNVGTFAHSGGIAKVVITLAVSQADGTLKPLRLEFIAEECKGVSLLAEPAQFTCTMLQMERTVAENEALLEEPTLTAAVDNAPTAIVA